MMKPAPEDRKLELAMELLEKYLTSYVETGLVEVGDRATEEILGEIIRNISEDVKCEYFELRPVYDHRDSLLDRASSAASEGQLEIAVVLYMTWIEHFVNGLLLLSLERQGISLESCKVLIRELRLAAKLTALWEIARLPELSATHLKLIDRAASLRNAFVHYKWPSVSKQEEDHRRDELGEIVAQIGSLAQTFHEIENQALWSGRRDEVIQALHNSVVETEKEIGPNI
jgi:hypothetical protein